MNCGTREVEIVASSYGVMVMCDILGSSACSNANMTGEQCIATMDSLRRRGRCSGLGGRCRMSLIELGESMSRGSMPDPVNSSCSRLVQHCKSSRNGSSKSTEADTNFKPLIDLSRSFPSRSHRLLSTRRLSVSVSFTVRCARNGRRGNSRASSPSA